MSEFIKKDSLKSIIQNGDAEELNRYAEELGKRFKDELTVKDERGRVRKENALSTSQIRNILDEIQRIPKREGFEKIKNRLHLLRPKLAYAAGRHKGRVKEFSEVVEEETNHFTNFRNFIEAIVAYHRYHGGEE